MLTETEKLHRLLGLQAFTCTGVLDASWIADELAVACTGLLVAPRGLREMLQDPWGLMTM